MSVSPSHASSHSPIIVLDSGLGGLTVVRALQTALPHEDFLYFGDTTRLPYGSKSPATVTSFVRQIITYLLESCKPLLPKQIVIACNTATALALPTIRKEFPSLSISGVIEPGATAAIKAAGRVEEPVIGIIATEATIRSKAYERAIHRKRHLARLALRSTPLLAPMIEEGRQLDDPLLRLAIEQYLSTMIKHGLQVLVLGCTHYPIVKSLIQEIVGDEVTVIDSAQQCADDVARRLAATGLLRAGSKHPGSLQCFVTDDTPRFKLLAGRFLGTTIPTPTWVSPDDLYNIVHESSGVRRAV